MFSNMRKSMAPTEFLPRIYNRNNVNQTCLTNIIAALDEDNATELGNIDYDCYHNIVDKSIDAYYGFKDHLKVGETMLKLSWVHVLGLRMAVHKWGCARDVRNQDRCVVQTCREPCICDCHVL